MGDAAATADFYHIIIISLRLPSCALPTSCTGGRKERTGRRSNGSEMRPTDMSNETSLFWAAAAA